MTGPSPSRLDGRAVRGYRPSAGTFAVVREFRFQPRTLGQQFALEGTDAFLECGILARGFVRLRCDGRSAGASDRITKGEEVWLLFDFIAGCPNHRLPGAGLDSAGLLSQSSNFELSD